MSFLDILYSMGSCLSCFPSTPTLKINERSFKILRLLGEGGFSYVYLVQDNATAELFALKKIRCPFGAESVALAMREVEAYRQFAHAEGIIHSIDYSVVTESGGGGGGNIGGGGDSGPAKTVYILLPYYRRGNLQDLINANLVNHTQFPEKHLLQLFLGICRALREMHQYRGAGAATESMTVPGQKQSTKGRRGGGGGPAAGNGASSGSASGSAAAARADDEYETEQQRPLMAEDAEHHRGSAAAGKSFAHRDIKPGNIMIADDGTTPILMDLGSMADSPLAITSRSLAIATQDVAAEHSTMPYRAPELFDVKTGDTIDTKVDIWSLGCTLYACLVGKSPFELRSDETGGSLQICVLSGDWRFPDEGPGGAKKKPAAPKRTNTGTGGGGGSSSSAAAAAEDAVISEPVREVVRRCLQVEPAERPDIDELIELVEATIAM